MMKLLKLIMLHLLMSSMKYFFLKFYSLDNFDLNVFFSNKIFINYYNNEYNIVFYNYIGMLDKKILLDFKKRQIDNLEDFDLSIIETTALKNKSLYDLDIYYIGDSELYYKTGTTEKSQSSDILINNTNVIIKPLRVSGFNDSGFSEKNKEVAFLNNLQKHNPQYFDGTFVDKGETNKTLEYSQSIQSELEKINKSIDDNLLFRFYRLSSFNYYVDLEKDTNKKRYYIKNNFEETKKYNDFWGININEFFWKNEFSQEPGVYYYNDFNENTIKQYCFLLSNTARFFSIYYDLSFVRFFLFINYGVFLELLYDDFIRTYSKENLAKKLGEGILYSDFAPDNLFSIGLFFKIVKDSDFSKAEKINEIIDFIYNYYPQQQYVIKHNANEYIFNYSTKKIHKQGI